MSEQPNIEKLQLCSMAFSERMALLDEEGITYHSDTANAAAAQAIQSNYPDFTELLNRTVQLEAMEAVSLGGEQTYRFKGRINVAGVLRTIRIQQLTSSEYLEDISLTMNRYDLCAILVPEYEESSHDEILSGDQLYVPFSAITGLDT